ncbi:hypothetical protein ADUPG1_008153 [Aduncisulcus paluster]|uniref:Uncharacterized protein n=1 Tax=Aduncisulcus paluster TaxID=2918883 RepID=A0ABQ5KTY0_9EUKA|nr:hypothetical protein ADUPG1_008153 [Aduncisulcus paluster]|eukprot:gnl/Carplike_NY0171/3338_a4490_369.p1 GENE.gnl/Carplike_NY0171/3338_a4490_369~~gnl/Carplike_NY0171/3338_a4490_369.p1  ORF type:complete len:437 (-),score=89.06 gnl/Carplike_NY0171/3338_a4490_369:174-1484(-)
MGCSSSKTIDSVLEPMRKIHNSPRKESESVHSSPKVISYEKENLPLEDVLDRLLESENAGLKSLVELCKMNGISASSTLSLQGHIIKQDAELLSNLLLYLTGILDVQCFEVEADDETCGILGLGLVKQSKTLTSIDISNCELDSIASILSHVSPMISSLSIHECSLSSSDIEAFSETNIFQSFENLERLSLFGLGLGDFPIETLSFNMHHLSSLTRLSLHHNNLTNASLSSLTEAILSDDCSSLRSQLTHLELHNNRYDVTGALELIVALTTPSSSSEASDDDSTPISPKLEHLSLDVVCPLGQSEEHLTKLFTTLRAYPRISRLTLGNLSLEASSQSSLDSLLSSLKLRSLALPSLGISSADTVSALSESILGCKHLSSLDLTGCRLDSEMCSALISPFSESTSLKRINLSDSTLKPEEKAALRDTLKQKKIVIL